MKASTILIAGALLVGAVEVYLADGDRRTFGSGVLQEHLSIYDEDNSGTISVEELQALQADQEHRRDRLRNRWDLDDDGESSATERAAARVEMRRLIVQRRSMRFHAEDQDNDGHLTMAEFAGLTAVADLNAADPTLAANIFKRLDENGDTKVSLSEFLKGLDRVRTPHDEVGPQAVPKPHPDSNGTAPTGGN